MRSVAHVGTLRRGLFGSAVLLLLVGATSAPASPESPASTGLTLFLGQNETSGILPPRSHPGDLDAAFVYALMRGALADLLPEGCRNYRRSEGQLRISCQPALYDARLSQELIRAVHGSLIATLVGDIPLQIRVSDEVIVHFAVMNAIEGPIVRIDSIQGFRVTQNQSLRLIDMTRFLDVSRYRFILSRNHFFAGVLGDPRERRFDYYVYSSETDMGRRPLREILRRSNASVRASIRPYVITFPDFES